MDGTLDRDGLKKAFQLARSLRRAAPRVDPTSVCLDLIAGTGLAELQDAVSAFKGDAFDYVVASIYALLLSEERRKELGAYFTPPHLVRHLLRRLAEHGLDCARHSIHDPAAGGAAFVVPLVRDTARLLLLAGTAEKELAAVLATRLSGMELDAGLATVANALVRRTLASEFGVVAEEGFRLVRVGDSLTEDVAQSDAVVGNPPYAKVGARKQRDWAKSFADILGGQLNLYAMFLRRSMDQVLPGGVVGVVVPTSFLHGPEFQTLRVALLSRADLLRVDLIEKRTDMFLDVIQDACCVVFRRHVEAIGTHDAPLADCAILGADGVPEVQGQFIPRRDGSPWVLPSPREMAVGGHVLADYGYRCTVGYLVVNRQGDRLSRTPGQGKVPLVRAACVRMDGDFDLLACGAEFVAVTAQAKYVVREPCVAIQRTANRKQARRINAAAIPASLVHQHGGLVGENHVLFLLAAGKPKVSPAAMSRLMNSGPVNARWGRTCGTINLSAKLLGTLDLPEPNLVAKLDELEGAHVDEAVSTAYSGSLNPQAATSADARLEADLPATSSPSCLEAA